MDAVAIAPAPLKATLSVKGMKRILIVLLLMPTVVIAEVSDKMPSIEMLVGQGIVISIAFLLAGWFRWWLGVITIPIFILFTTGSISLWNEVHMREALINEQGMVYFWIHAAQDIVIGMAAIGGIFLGRARNRLTRKC